MKKIYLALPLFSFFSSVFFGANGQTNQNVVNGRTTAPVTFAGVGCNYSWTNDMPEIGLASSGLGNIPSFRAINNTTRPIVATITLTSAPQQGLAFVASRGNATVSVIDTKTDVVLSSISTGPAYGVSVSPGGGYVYTGNDGTGNISVINTATLKLAATIPVSGATYFGSITVSPDGTRAYATNTEPGLISVINTSTNSSLTNIPLGTYLTGVAVSHDGSRIYVGNNGDNSVSVINASDYKVIATIPVPAGPNAIFMSPDGNQIYVINGAADNVAVLSPTSNNVIATIPVGTAPFAGAITPDGKFIYVTNQKTNDVSVINTLTATVVSTIAVGSIPTGISVTTDGAKVYVVNTGDNTVSVISTATNMVVGNIPVMADAISIGNFITGNSGCLITPYSFTITVNPSIIVPNAFTPNGDGINDTWNINKLSDYPRCTVAIFTRNGAPIYQSTGYPKPWDGQFNNEPLPTGTYYYVIDLHDGTKQFAGDVSILR